MHAHASDSKLTEIGSAKFFAKSDGSTVVQKKGMLSDREVRIIQDFIKEHYLEMYELWKSDSDKEFYEGNCLKSKAGTVSGSRPSLGRKTGDLADRLLLRFALAVGGIITQFPQLFHQFRPAEQPEPKLHHCQICLTAAGLVGKLFVFAILVHGAKIW